MAYRQDWNQMLYIYGELQWAAFGPSEVEEAALQGAMEPE